MTDATETDAFGPPPQPAGPGDNLPPTDTDALIADRLEHLPGTYAYLTDRRDELLESAARAPEVIEDAEMLKRFSTLVKQVQALLKQTETGREGEKNYWLKGGKRNDAWFHLVRDPMKQAKKILEDRQTEWQLKAAAIERRHRLEQERVAREIAERLAREAAEREKLLQAANAKAADLDNAIAAEALAKQAAADAEAAAKAAAAKPADLSRERSEEGAVASLRTWWDYRDIDPDKLDLEKLRHHFTHGDPKNALEMAVKAFIKAGGRNDDIDGVVIFENSRTVNH